MSADATPAAYDPFYNDDELPPVFWLGPQGTAALRAGLPVPAGTNIRLPAYRL